MDYQGTVEWSVGIAASGLLVYMSYLSLQEGFTLHTPVIIGMLSLIVLLLYGKRPLLRLVGVWAGDDSVVPEIGISVNVDDGGGEPDDGVEEGEDT